MNKNLEKIDIREVLGNKHFETPGLAGHKSYDNRVRFPKEYENLLSELDYVGRIQGIVDNPEFISIVTNNESIDYIVNDVMSLTKAVSIDVADLTIGDNTIIGTLYASIRDPKLYSDYLNELSMGNNALIIKANINILDNTIREICRAIDQIHAMNPAKSAFVILNDMQYCAGIFSKLNRYGSNNYYIVKE